MLTASNVQLNADVIKGLQRLISIVEPFQINMVNGSTSEFTTYYDISVGNAECIQDTAQLMGYSHCGVNIKNALQDSLDELLKDNFIEEVNGKLREVVNK